MNIDSQLRDIIQRAIDEHGSVYKLSDAADVTNSVVNEWMAGRRASMGWSTVSKLCDYLGVTLKEPKKAAKRKKL